MLLQKITAQNAVKFNYQLFNYTARKKDLDIGNLKYSIFTFISVSIENTMILYPILDSKEERSAPRFTRFIQMFSVFENK